MTAEPRLLDPFAPEVRADPYPVYHRLRETDPVHPTGQGSYLLSRYSDVERILRDPSLFSSDFTNSLRFRQDQRPATPETGLAAGIGQIRSSVMLFSDPPDHTRLRTLVNKAFTVRAVEAMRPRVQQIVDELLDDAQQRHEMDVIADLAFPLPVIVICEMLGIPASERDQFKGWSTAIATTLDPIADLQEASKRMDAAAPSAIQMFMYLSQVVQARRDEPRGDLVSALIHAEQDGDQLTHQELMGMLILLFIAGHETTLNLIGNGTLALLRNPSQLQRLREDPSLIRTAVEELLRFDSPVQLTARTAMRDVQIDGVTVEQGETVTALIGAANRDPAVFDDPDALDVGRRDNRHLSFGGGPHFCLGAPLARLEGQIAFSTLARRFPGLELASDDVRHRDTFTLRGLEALPVRL